MKALLLALAALLSIASHAEAQVTKVNLLQAPPVVLVSYTGPANVVASPDFDYSCTFAVSAAYAAGHGNLCDIVRASDSASCTIKSSSAGSTDLVGAPCTGSSGTCTGGSSPCTIGTFCASDTCTISKFYDQAGTNLCTSGTVPCDQTQATVAKQATLNLSCVSSLPCANFTANTLGYSTSVSGGTSTVINQPYTWATIAERTSGVTSNSILTFAASTNVQFGWSCDSTAAHFGGYGGSCFVATGVTDSAYHALASVYNNTSGIVSVDGSATTGLTTGTNNYGPGDFQIGDSGDSASPVGNVVEITFWPAGLTTGQLTSLASNATTRCPGC